MVLEWLRERFAKPCRVGSIPTHASIFLPIRKIILQKADGIAVWKQQSVPRPILNMKAEYFWGIFRNELDKRKKGIILLTIRFEKNNVCSGGGMADALA